LVFSRQGDLHLPASPLLLLLLLLLLAEETCALQICDALLQPIVEG
jgi:hypothetical protein